MIRFKDGSGCRCKIHRVHSSALFGRPVGAFKPHWGLLGPIGGLLGVLGSLGLESSPVEGAPINPMKDEPAYKSLRHYGRSRVQQPKLP